MLINPWIRIPWKVKQYDNNLPQTIVLFVVAPSGIIYQKIGTKDKPTIALWRQTYRHRSIMALAPGRDAQEGHGFRIHSGDLTGAWQQRPQPPPLPPGRHKSHFPPHYVVSPLRIYLPKLKWPCSCDIPAKRCAGWSVRFHLTQEFGSILD